MIFALKSSSTENDFSPPVKKSCDIYCLFSHSAAVQISEKEFFLSICASLREQREVLIFDSPKADIPEINFSSLWKQGDNWLWMPSRVYRLFSGSYMSMNISLISINSVLKSAKQS